MRRSRTMFLALWLGSLLALGVFLQHRLAVNVPDGYLSPNEWRAWGSARDRDAVPAWLVSVVALSAILHVGSQARGWRPAAASSWHAVNLGVVLLFVAPVIVAQEEPPWIAVCVVGLLAGGAYLAGRPWRPSAPATAPA